MFKIDRTLLKPNISRTIRFTQPLSLIHISEPTRP